MSNYNDARRGVEEVIAEVCAEPVAEARFRMIQRGDFIKPGWWHWRCRHEDDSGDVDYGYVQADSLGKIVVPETFERDRR